MHYLSVLAIMKNEAMNIKLWIDHYRWQGVDHIYLIDNGSTDNSVDIVKDLQSENYPITLHCLPKQHAQMEHYAWVFNHEELDKKTKWLIMADIDEFFYCNKSTIRKELPKYEQYKVIFSKWRMFGSDGLDAHPMDIRISITHRVHALHINKKYIFQTDGIQGNAIKVHYIENYESLSNEDLSDIFRLNHYPIQSKEYYRKVKMTRGDVNSEHYDYFRNWNYFRHYDLDTTYNDTDLKQMVVSLDQDNTPSNIVSRIPTCESGSISSYIHHIGISANSANLYAPKI